LCYGGYGETNVVVVQHMCSDAIDQCRGFDAAPSTVGYERGKRRTKGAAQLAVDKSNFRFA